MKQRKPTFRCFCGKIFRTQGWLKKHQNTKHPTTQPAGLGTGKTWIAGDYQKALARFAEIKHCTFCPNCGTKLPTL